MATLEESRAALEAAKRESREWAAWYKWLSVHSSEVVPCQSNLDMARRYFGQRPDDPGAAQGEELSFAALEESWTNPSFRQMLALRTEGDERLALCTEILAHYPSDGAKREIAKHFKHKDTAQLRADLAELQRRKELSGRSTDELRQIIKPQDDDYIPEKYTREAIFKMSADELTKFLQKYDQTPGQKREVLRRLNDRSGESR